jgi:hypothetical protein
VWCVADKYDKEVVEEEGIPLERRVVAKAGKCCKG